MEPEFVAKRSVIGYCGGRLFLCLLFCWLIVPVFLGIYLIFKNASYKLYFYSDKIICRYGVISKHESISRMTTIMGVSINYSAMGRILNYGDVHVDVVGKWDVSTNGIKRPAELKNYLDSCMNRQNLQNVQQLIAN